MDLVGQYLDTVGIELEGEGLTRDDVTRAIYNPIYPQLDNDPRTPRTLEITRDASTESIFKYVKISGSSRLLMVYNHTKASKHFRSASGDSQRLGYEVVISPRSVDDLTKLIPRIMIPLENAGDFITERAAIHFHVGFVNNLRLLKRLLRILLAIDPLLFRLGGMGRENRGNSNLYAYARPLLYPTCVPVSGNVPTPPRRRVTFSSASATTSSTSRINGAPSMTIRELEERAARIREEIETDQAERSGGSENSGNYAQIINTDRAMQAENITQFWESMGIFVNYNGTPHYHPARYLGCNFYAIPAHGTIEFRHFNQSFDHSLVVSIAKFLRTVVEVSTVARKKDIQMFDVADPATDFSTDDALYLMESILKIAYEQEMENTYDDNDIATMLESYERSSFPQVKWHSVKTHLREFSLPRELVERAGLEYVKRPFSPKHIDIHNIKNRTLVDKV